MSQIQISCSSYIFITTIIEKGHLNKNNKDCIGIINGVVLLAP